MVFHWLRKLWFTAPGDAADAVLNKTGEVARETGKVVEQTGIKVIRGAESAGKAIKDA